MDRLDPTQQGALKKDATERIQARLVRVNDEEQVFTMERPALLELMAEHMLTPQGAVGGDPGTAARAEAHTEATDLRERELALHEAELELRKEEIRLQEQRLAEDYEWRRVEARRLQTRDEQQVEREGSLPVLTKKRTTDTQCCMSPVYHRKYNHG